MNEDIGELQITLTRLMPEEAFKAFLYDDATDLPVKAPVGNATIGYGCNVQAGWSQDLAKKVLMWQLETVQARLFPLPWYQALSALRRSVCLDVAFNDGIEGFLNGYPKMIAALQVGNFVQAAIQCTTDNPRLQARYLVLAHIMLTDQIAS